MTNEKNKLEGIFPISMSETECSHCVKPVVLLNYMQDLAARSIECYDDELSCNELLKKGLGWFLIRYRIEFDTHPKDIKEVLVKTELRGVDRINTYRDFEVFDNSTNQRILRATSLWFLVNLDTKSMINFNKEFPDVQKYEKREDDLVLNKLKFNDEFEIEKRFVVRYDDLDVNNHVNNTVYISWALEALDYQTRCDKKIKSMDIYFKHDVKYGEEVLSLCKINNNNSIHLIKNANTGDDLCLINIDYFE